MDTYMNTFAVLAQGLPMPKNCDTCDMRRIYSRMKPCPCPAVSGNLVRYAADAKQRREGCPLTEVSIDNVFELSAGKNSSTRINCSEVKRP